MSDCEEVFIGCYRKEWQHWEVIHYGNLTKYKD